MIFWTGHDLTQLTVEVMAYILSTVDGGLCSDISGDSAGEAGLPDMALWALRNFPRFILYYI